jgi:hypothetical protein
VSGTTEFNNVTTMAIQDPIISIGRGANNDPLTTNDGKDRGEQLFYYDSAEKSAFVGYLNGTGKLDAAKQATITNELVTINTYGSFVVGQLEGATVSVTGNITGGNVVGGANVNATTHTGATVSVSGNVNGGNIISATAISAGGAISAVGNITGGNILGGANVNATLHTGTTVSVTGTVTASQFTGSGAGLSSIPGANVSGTVPSATTAGSAGSAGSATTAGTVTTAAQPAITSLGALTSLIIPVAASDPGSPATGQFYYNTSFGGLRIWTGSFWDNV